VEDLGKPDFVSKISITVTAAGKLVSVMYHWRVFSYI
jgi:hypothetical protein